MMRTFLLNPILTLTRLLEWPKCYNFFQNIIADPKISRQRYVDEFIMPGPNHRILDIGCGDGILLSFLPKNIAYVGYDMNPLYIKAAKKRYGDRGQFFCDKISCKNAPQFKEQFDIVLATGLLHHLNDEEACQLMLTAAEHLKEGGKLITFDGVYIEKQSIIAKTILKLDRGRYVRKASQYQSLAEQVFSSVQITLVDDFLKIPYNHIIMTCKKASPK